MSKIENTKNSLRECHDTIQKYFDDTTTAVTPPDDETLKLCDEYFRWTALKTKLIGSEKTFVLPYSALPNKISEYVYNYLYRDKKDAVDRHYKKDTNNGYFVINANKKNVPINDVETIIHSLVLRRGNVVWVNFGFNVGHEFGGKHPALILKNTKDTLIVLPLSSQTPKNPDANVKIDNVYGLPLKTRWGNILRITPISIIRIDFLSPVGSVKNEILNDVSAKINLYGIK